MTGIVREYQNLVDRLLDSTDRDQAMAMAVGGGSWEEVGQGELGILRDTLRLMRPGISMLDMGCGSGRLAYAISRAYGDQVSYIGTDIVPKLLEYASSKSHPSYKFLYHPEMSYPVTDGSLDLITSFSVFTHIYERRDFYLLEGCCTGFTSGRGFGDVHS
jgi:SAM-dependent methyltransferase